MEWQHVLQRLYDTGKLQELFTGHYTAAISLNGIQDLIKAGRVKAISVMGRTLQIDDAGVVTLQPLDTPPPPEEPPLQESEQVG